MQNPGVLFAQECDGESHYWHSVEGYSRWTHTTGAMVRGYHGGGPWRSFSFLQLPGDWQLGQRKSASSGCSVWRYVSAYLSKSWPMIWCSKQSVPATIDRHSSWALQSAVSVGKIYLHSRLKAEDGFRDRKFLCNMESHWSNIRWNQLRIQSL